MPSLLSQSLLLPSLLLLLLPSIHAILMTICNDGGSGLCNNACITYKTSNGTCSACVGTCSTSNPSSITTWAGSLGAIALYSDAVCSPAAKFYSTPFVADGSCQAFVPGVASLKANSHCTSSDPCWPSSNSWGVLNGTVNGALRALYPETRPCNVTSPLDDPACLYVLSRFTDPVWRSQPAAMQAPNWEVGSDGSSCYVSTAPCVQGAVPTLGVVAQSIAHVSATVTFASSLNVKLVVKSSGHDYQGRSTASGSLVLWMGAFVGVTVSPSGSNLCGAPTGPTVTVLGGTPWKTVYAAVSSAGYDVVGGSARTVSALGGYLQGGGHSWQSPAYGLAVDNILSLSVVLASGATVTASACNNPDLFWALRGGGGGSFGVVVGGIFRIHPVPPPPSTYAGVVVVVRFLRGYQSANLFATALLQYTPSLLTPTGAGGGVWGGYWQMNSTSFSTQLVFNGSVAAATASFNPLQSFITGNAADFSVAFYSSIFPVASMNAWHDIIDPADTGDRTGGAATLASRLVPRAVCTDPVARASAAVVLAGLAQKTIVQGHMVAGGAVAAADPTSSSTSVTPAWRTAVMHVAVGVGWDVASPAQPSLAASAFTLASQYGDELRAAFPNSGSYWNEADYNEPSWQSSFWGAANYARLQAIKRSVDPSGLFSCWHCVQGVEITSPTPSVTPSPAPTSASSGPPGCTGSATFPSSVWGQFYFAFANTSPIRFTAHSVMVLEPIVAPATVPNAATELCVSSVVPGPVPNSWLFSGTTFDGTAQIMCGLVIGNSSGVWGWIGNGFATTAAVCQASPADMARTAFPGTSPLIWRDAVGGVVPPPPSPCVNTGINTLPTALQGYVPELQNETPPPLPGVGYTQLRTDSAVLKYGYGVMSQILCMSSVSPVAAIESGVDAPLTQFQLYSGPSCVWVQYTGGQGLLFKGGNGVSCPTNFTGARTFSTWVPWTGSSGLATPSSFATLTSTSAATRTNSGTPTASATTGSASNTPTGTSTASSSNSRGAVPSVSPTGTATTAPSLSVGGSPTSSQSTTPSVSPTQGSAAGADKPQSVVGIAVGVTAGVVVGVAGALLCWSKRGGGKGKRLTGSSKGKARKGAGAVVKGVPVDVTAWPNPVAISGGARRTKTEYPPVRPGAGEGAIEKMAGASV